MLRDPASRELPADPAAPTAAPDPSVRWRYLGALVLVAVLSCSAYAVLRGLLAAQSAASEIINVSGAQRMLSQRTSLLAVQLAVESDPQRRDELRADLEAAAERMFASHLRLSGVDTEAPLDDLATEELEELYFGAGGLDRQVREHVTRVDAILAAPDAALGPELPALVALLERAPGGLLADLNRAVGLYEAEAERRLARLESIETLVLALTLLTLLLEGLLIFRPMERAIARRTAELVHNALHDPLTGLANRALLHRRLGAALERSEREPERRWALLYLDLDRFKVINDSLGHEVGDRLLVEVAERLQRCVRGADTVARLGGDEFVVLLDSVAFEDDAERVAGRLAGALADPFEFGGQRVFVEASIGILDRPAGAQRPEDALRDADMAMYRAKTSGRGRAVRFDPAMHERAVHLLTLETDLRQAITRQELEVHYQPIRSARSGRPGAVEALVRWRHPALGMVSPAEFLPLAEETGLIAEVDRFVLLETCRRLRAWSEAHPWLPPLRASVNLSPSQLRRDDLVDSVRGILEATGVAAERIILELTENGLIDPQQGVVDALLGLRDLGLRLVVDDFGTGHSSLAYLHELPVAGIKIDRSFVQRLGSGGAGDSSDLVASIVAMARRLNLSVVAEGVETSEQTASLGDLGDIGLQGYHIARPMPAEDIDDFLAGFDRAGVGVEAGAEAVG